MYKELYAETLGGFTHTGDTIEEACCLSDGYLDSKQTEFKELLKNNLGDVGLKSELYQKALYELAPANLIEVFFTGVIIGRFESMMEQETDKDDSPDSEKAKVFSSLKKAIEMYYHVLDKVNEDDHEEKASMEKNLRKLLEAACMIL